ncbi:hypothetical protein Lalb_Chr06g0174061 [Lupinus albus]|uniref:Uncharacterized protein n=1 Tax=Lupinus albus TaxID=3870 RepID=A0A6A4QG68_LUPAL|nr:hypothetical protein Lalb_Chr06g0174061 [Lupinus albus]
MMKSFSLLILLLLSLLICSSSSMATTTLKETKEQCKGLKIIRILYCKNEECEKRCSMKYTPIVDKYTPQCSGRDTCVCCDDMGF